MTHIAVITTVPDLAEARRIATALVERRLVACVQISEIESVFRWDGAVRHEREHRLVCKTVTARYEAVEQALLALHPYEVPAIHAMALDRVQSSYADWLDTESSGEPSVAT